MRKFKIIREDNTEYDLNVDQHFLENPKGLGLEKDYTATRLKDNQYFSNESSKLLPITFDLILTGTAIEIYQEYENFVLFNQKGIKFGYQPQNKSAYYYRMGLITKIDKKEITDNYMRCTVIFMPATFWLGEEQAITIKKGNMPSKKYSLNRPYHYGAKNFEFIKIHNPSELPTPLKITIRGNCLNPMWQVMKGKIIVGKARFIGEFDKVFVNSNALMNNIVLTKGKDDLLLPYNYQDMSVGLSGLTEVTFLFLKEGENILSFFFENDFDGEVDISWSNVYETI